MPKWHGSREDMLDFARETLRNAPPNSRAPIILSIAHWDIYEESDYKKGYFKDPVVWSELKATYQHVLNGFPESNRTRNWFARTAYLAGEYETAKLLFDEIGDKWFRGCWGNAEYFNKIKKIVYKHTASS